MKLVSVAVLAAIFLATIWSTAHADPANAPKVIDIGNLEVEGELRRPNIQWIDSNRKTRDMLADFHDAEFHDLEAELLKPAGVKEYKKECVAAQRQKGVQDVKR